MRVEWKVDESGEEYEDWGVERGDCRVESGVSSLSLLCSCRV